MSENTTRYSSDLREQSGRRSLRWLILISFLALVIALSVILGAMGAVMGFQETRQAAVEHLQIAANLKQQQIERWMDDRGADLAVLSIDFALVDNLKDLREQKEESEAYRATYSDLFAQLTGFLQRKSAFTELFVMDADSGITLLSTDLLREGESHSSKLYFEQGKQETYYRSMSASPFDPDLQVPFLMITHPVRDPDTDRVIAVLGGRANLRDLGDVINEMGGLEGTSETYLVSSKQQIIVSSRGVEAQGRAAHSLGIEAALDGQDGWDTYQSYTGEEVTGAYRWLSRLGLALMVEQKQSAVTQAARLLVFRNIAVTLIALAVAGWATMTVSRVIVQPLTHLTQAATAIAEGNLDREIEIERHDEIGALANAFAQMTARLRNLIGSLERRVAERTQALAYRSVQLETAAQVSEAAGSILKPEELEQRVVELIRSRFDYYYVGLFLVDEAGEWAVLHAGTGEAGQTMLKRGHKLKVGGESMIGGCVADGEAKIALDVGTEAVRFDNPLLPETRSEMALPLLARGEIIGALTVQSEREAAFSEEDISILQTMAAQVANAIQNAHLFEETRRVRQEQERRSEELQTLYQVSLELAQEQRDFNMVLESITHSSMDLLQADGGGVWLWREKDQELELTITFQVGDVQMTGRRLKPGEGLSGQAFLERKIQVVDDYLAWTGYSSTFEDAPFFAALAVPMIWQDQVVGILVTTRSQPGFPFSAAEQDLAQLLASQAAAFVQNARLFEQTRRRNVQLQAAAEVSRAASSILDMDELLSTSADLIRDSFDFYYVGLFVLDERGEFAVLRAATGEAGRRMLAEEHKLAVGGESMIGACVADGQPRIALDVGKEAVRFENPLLPETRSEMALPLRSRGQVVGAMTIHSTEETAFSEADISVLQVMADQVANILVNAQLFKDVEQRVAEMETLYEVSLQLAAGGELDDILQAIINQAAELLQARDGGIYLYDRTTDELEWVVGYGAGKERIGVRLKRGEGLSGKAMLERRTMLIEDYETWEGRSADFEDMPATTVVAVPLLWQDQIVGVLNLGNEKGQGSFDQDAVRLLTLLAQQAAAAIANARLLEETQANLEEITRLHRRYLREQWEEFLEEEEIQERTAYLFDRHQVRPAGDLWRPEIEMAVARGRTLALTAEAEELRAGDGGVQSALVVPLRLREQIIGALDFFETEREREWSEEDIALVEDVAVQVALAVENARAYEQLQKTAVQLQETDRLKSQFLANMSHELRTPLNSIIGFSRVMLKGIDGPLTDLQRIDLTSIYNNGQNLLGLINDILDMSRIEAGKMELVFEPVNIGPIIEGVMSTAVGLVKDKQLKLIKEVPDDLPIVRADTTRIRQVILNLISNAAKFTEKGSITVRAWVDDENLGISVTDTGTGIPEDQLEKIFEEFQQVDGSSTRSVGGTGLGLPISRHFVELHGGRIWVESEMGLGSTFAFVIPIHGPERVQDAELTALEIDPDRRLVLVVEAEEGMVGLYRRYLERHGYQIVGLTDVERVPVWVRELSPFAVLLDVIMPEADGWELLENLKTARETAQVPVVVCTIADEETRGLSMGAAAYLTKPVLEKDLLQALALLERA